MTENLEKAAMHDLGGRSKYLCIPVDRTPDASLEDEFGKAVVALLLTLRTERLMTVDELRVGVESLTAEEYARLNYYERWLRSIVATLVRRGLLDAAELAP